MLLVIMLAAVLRWDTIGVVLLLCLCLITNSNVSAFLIPSPTTGNNLLRCIAANDRGHRQRINMVKDDESVESEACHPGAAAVNAAVNSGVDSAARRRILFSMLATASSVPLMSNVEAVAAAESNEVTVATATTAAAAAGVAFFATNDDILKSPKDKRKYEAYTLENGLRVLLCSDPSSQEAAAAMDVHVGATSDPPEVQGLAHFTEHVGIFYVW